MSSTDTEIRSAAGRVGPADDRPLTEQEFQLLQRLLSDPFSFPNQYKTWLVSYLETSDLSLPMSAIQGLTQMLGISGVGTGTLGILPAGIIFPFGGLSAPAGSLMCDGTAYPRASQSRLFSAIGTQFGAPDGSSFNVPDIQERILSGAVHAAATRRSARTKAAVSARAGLEHHHGTHNHPVTDPTHRHGLNAAGGATTGGGPQLLLISPRSTPLRRQPASVSPRPKLARRAIPNRPAFLVLNFIIIA